MSAPESRWLALDYPGATILMRAETAVEKRFRLRACEKEPWTAAWLDTINPGDRLVNVGANVGSYALIAAYRGARVIAIEANPINHARLIENAVMNVLGYRLLPLLAVCSATSQPWYVGTHNQMAGTADLDMILQAIGKGLPTPVTSVPGVTLDELAEVYGQPTHLLIDVDGGEVDVLRGGAETLAGVRDVMIEVSTDPGISKGCTALLEAAGLTLAERWDSRQGVTIEDVWYGLFRRQPP